MPLLTEADTCRKYVLPKLYAAGWTDDRIWLCEYHGKFVDNNRGAKYPAAFLLSYKELHKSRIARAHKGIYAPFAWFQELKVDQGPLFKMRANFQGFWS